MFALYILSAIALAFDGTDFLQSFGSSDLLGSGEMNFRTSYVPQIELVRNKDGDSNCDSWLCSMNLMRAEVRSMLPSTFNIDPSDVRNIVTSGIGSAISVGLVEIIKKIKYGELKDLFNWNNDKDDDDDLETEGRSGESVPDAPVVKTVTVIEQKLKKRQTDIDSDEVHRFIRHPMIKQEQVITHPRIIQRHTVESPVLGGIKMRKTIGKK